MATIKRKITIPPRTNKSPLSDITNLFKKNPFLIAVVGFILVVIFLLIKNAGGAQSTAQPPVTPGDHNIGLPGQHLYTAYVPTQAPPSEVQPTGTTTAPPISPMPPTQNPPTSSGALIPKGQWPANVRWANGSIINWAGRVYTVVVGTNVIWGVPGTYSATEAVKHQGIVLYNK